MIQQSDAIGLLKAKIKAISSGLHQLELIATFQSRKIKIDHDFMGINSTVRDLRGFAKLKKFKKSKNYLEVGGWVQVPFG